mmetsp:Transcript_39186/g.88001  ORF Transcript_39186/g.88001 Transcript_39186/m.88001 type:complete len:87 (-) Transcript_39186:63-323(-)
MPIRHGLQASVAVGTDSSAQGQAGCGEPLLGKAWVSFWISGTRGHCRSVHAHQNVRRPRFGDVELSCRRSGRHTYSRMRYDAENLA